jgi:hypothetical protein
MQVYGFCTLHQSGGLVLESFVCIALRRVQVVLDDALRGRIHRAAVGAANSTQDLDVLQHDFSGRDEVDHVGRADAVGRILDERRRWQPIGPGWREA